MATIKAAWPQYALWIEPGRYLVAESGVLLARVTQVNEKARPAPRRPRCRHERLLRPALYEAWHEIVNLSRPRRRCGCSFDVVGPICETGDVLGKRRSLPEATTEGDIVLIADAGAYGRVMSSRYNLRELPQEEVLDD
jgi:diaminopimelate decarboxylase/aspartate kinase